MTEVRPRPSVISSGAKQNREIPLHYAACLYCQERYSPHFCRIVCHLTPDSLKSPQISNPPLVLRTTFLHGKASQTSSLKSQTSPIETFRPLSPLYRQRAGKAWRTFFHSPNARIPWKRGRKSRSHHVTSVSPVHRK